MELCHSTLQGYIDGTRIKGSNSPDDKDPIMATSGRIRPQMPHVWEIMEQITCGVEFIHSLDWVHRDLKPQNSMLPSLNSFRVANDL